MGVATLASATNIRSRVDRRVSEQACPDREYFEKEPYS